MSTLSQHFLFSFNTCCAHSYCIPALCAYISTIFEHFLHAFLCVSFNACIPFIIFKRNGDLTGSPCWWPIRMGRCNAVRNVPVLILLKINDMGPYGIHLTKWHLISRHHGEIYTTRSVQSRPPPFQQPQDRTEHRTHHVDFLTLGSMCLLIFIISTLTFRSRSC